MQHLRIVPGRNIAIGGNALTSSFMDDVYEAGTPGKFKFSSFELGATSKLLFPVPMGMHFTVGYLVSVYVGHGSVVGSFIHPHCSS